jgi:ATP-dependent Clp protease ATP-binding subunit ClpC
LVAGTKYRGQFEERIKNLIEEVRDNPDIIMFIDEIHTMIGAGNSSGALDAANIFKPALARGEIQCIGATTLDEYREHIEKDGALERRFQKVIVDAPNMEQTKTILFNIRETYEEFHKVKYTDTAIEMIVKLADRYITNREFPDKAIDILDEAGSTKQIGVKTPTKIKELEAKIKEIQIKKENVVKSQDYEEAAELRDLEKTIGKELVKEKEFFKNSLNENKIPIDENVICEVVSKMTGIPVSNISQDEIERLLNIENEMSGSVIGQKEAIQKISSAIKRNRTGIRKQQKPIGSFMFIGPTGVGKTELAKTLAKNVFGSEESIIRVDMSEYGEKFNISKLIGSPPGYVGYNEGGQLTETFVRCLLL